MLLGVDNVAAIRLNAQQWVLRNLNRLAGRVRGGQGTAPHLVTGLDGELEAFFHLRRLGYVVVARRWRSEKLRGDLDLIAWQGSCLCFVEVKTRTKRDLVPAEFSVDEDKQQMLRRMAGAYLHRFKEEQRKAFETRFDVVSVYMEAGKAAEFEVFAGAFH